MGHLLIQARQVEFILDVVLIHLGKPMLLISLDSLGKLNIHMQTFQVYELKELMEIKYLQVCS